MSANAAIFYHPDGFDTATKMMGRQAAGESLLRALARDQDFGPVIGAVPDKDVGQAMLRQFTAMGGQPQRLSTIALDDQAAIARVGCLMRPDPVLGEHAWRRRRMPVANAYSLCGLTHTVSSAGAADGLGAMLLAPMESWDAVICTSVSVRRVIERILGGYAEYLGERFGAQPQFRAQLPVIPLGVNSADFAAAALAPHRGAWRAKLGIGAEDFVVLYLGRLSFHAKANPAAMMQAAQRCAQTLAAEGGPKVHLIFAGDFFVDNIEQAFRAAPPQFCPAVRCHFLDGKLPEVRRFIWAAADAFISLVDNIQETFGLTPLEAMAAGLPVVVSDWDGYRETVRHGQDGMLVPSLASPPETAPDIAVAFADGRLNYDHYIGAMSNLAAIDIAAAAEALTALARDPQLRRRLGENGRERAARHFDWRLVLKAWRELWADLAERRAKAVVEPRPGRLHPLRPDPTTLFADYPTAYLAAGSIVHAEPGWDWPRIQRALAAPLFSHSVRTVAEAKHIERIFSAVAAKSPMSLQSVAGALGDIAQVRVLRAILMLAKIGALRVEQAAPNKNRAVPL